ncbi:MAG: hypothetical protein COW18_01035 [Zetaproteobacteria bacterium CG12_big_fil_rev_8_21_14_0_65_54_13]|nr:MAG: hypothetical protein COW18_01035 [Zetaproteobacteria bacterium CG12_big_fil_rev_8_21_14_0_65_54_13]
MFIEQMAKYSIVIGHLIASPAIWLVTGISVLANIFTAQWASWGLLALMLYIGTGIFNCFAHGEFRVTTAQALTRARPVIFPVILFSIKLSFIWLIPFAFAIAAVIGAGESAFSTAFATFIMTALMMVSLMAGPAIVLLKKDYRLWPTLTLLYNSLPLLLAKTWLAMVICITMLAINFMLATHEGNGVWLVIITPLIELSEYAFMLYMIGTFNSAPARLQVAD